MKFSEMKIGKPIKLTLEESKGDDIYTLPENPMKLRNRLIVLKESANDIAQAMFHHRVYQFVILRKHRRRGWSQRSRMRLFYDKNVGGHITSGMIGYKKIRELFDLVPDIEPDSEAIWDKIKHLK